MKVVKYPILVSFFLLLLTYSFRSFSHFDNTLKLSFADEHSNITSIFLSDTAQSQSLSEFRDFKGVLVINEKAQKNLDKLYDKEFAKTVKRVVYREKPTNDDLAKYGTAALRGIICISTK